MSFCLSTRMDNLLSINQTKYVIRQIIMIITLTRIENKVKNEPLSLIINSLTYVCLSGGKKVFFRFVHIS